MAEPVAQVLHFQPGVARCILQEGSGLWGNGIQPVLRDCRNRCIHSLRQPCNCIYGSRFHVVPWGDNDDKERCVPSLRRSCLGLLCQLVPPGFISLWLPGDHFLLPDTVSSFRFNMWHLPTPNSASLTFEGLPTYQALHTPTPFLLGFMSGQR